MTDPYHTRRSTVSFTVYGNDHDGLLQAAARVLTDFGGRWDLTLDASPHNTVYAGDGTHTIIEWEADIRAEQDMITVDGDTT